MFEQLLNPLVYLRMRASDGDQKKMVVDYFFPAIFSLFVIFLLGWFGGYSKINVYGDRGLLASLAQFIQTLPGFYMAGLAAVATLSRPGLDEKLSNPAVTIPERINGIWNAVPLTRRRFVCILFAFLTAESIFVVLLGVFGGVFADAIRVILPLEWHSLFASLFVGFFSFIFGQLIFVTLWSLYYLSNRIFRP